jgi:trimeric autotransporter adhesin
MSTKTTFKRVALVAVAALGLGVLTSVAPASATNASVTAISAGTSGPARVGITSGTTNIRVTVPANTGSLNVTAQITSAPATSSAAGLLWSAATSGAAVSPTYELITTKTASALPQPVNDDAAVANASFTASAGATTNLTLELKADVAGTYQVLVAVGGNTSTGFSSANRSTVYSITTTGAPTSIAATAVAGAVVDGGTKGQLWSVSLKDANGNATILGLNEAISIADADATTKVVEAADTASSTAITTLGSRVGGTYFFRVVDAGTIADGASVITLTGSGLLPATLTTNVSSTNIAATAAIGTETLTVTTATSYTTTALDFGADFGSAASSHSFTVTKAAAPAADTVNAVLVTPQTGASFAYDTSVTVLKAATTGAFTVAQALAATDTNGFTVAIAASQGTKEVSYKAPAAASIAVQGTKSILSAPAGKNTFTALVKNQYGAAMAFQAVTIGVSGRNTVATTALGVTDANGLISYTLTDAGTTGTTDTVKFTTGGLDDSATVTYGTVTVDK